MKAFCIFLVHKVATKLPKTHVIHNYMQSMLINYSLFGDQSEYEFALINGIVIDITLALYT